MKRLFVTCDYPPVIGGQATYFGNLWSDDGIKDSILLVPDIDYADIPLSCRSHLKKIWLPGGEHWAARILRLSLLSFIMVYMAIKFKPKEIHAGQLLVGGINALFIKILLRIPYVVYVFGADLLEFWKIRPIRPLLRWILMHGKCIVTCSKFTAEKVNSLVGERDNIVVVNPGVEDVYFNGDFTAAKLLKEKLCLEGKIIVLTVARLVERKGHDVVIKALPQILSRLPDVHYLIVGDGPCRDRLEQLTRKCGVFSNVTFTGNVSKEQLPLYYQLASLFVMVSRYRKNEGDVEGFGIVYLEANASGVPVVAAQSGGVEDAVKHGVNGMLVEDPTDCDSVARAMERVLIDDVYRGKLSHGAREWASNFTWEIQRKRWLRAIQ